MLGFDVTPLQAGVAVALIAGAVALFGARSEFHRTQRVRAYSEFAGAFVAAVNVGTLLGSIAMQLGTGCTAWRKASAPVWERWGTAHENSQRAKPLFDLVATKRARRAGDTLHTFFADDVLKAPPFVPGKDLKDAGEFA